MGIDISMQTATKYIGGHSDTLGGILTGSRQMMKKIFDCEYLAVGSGIQPFNAWLLIRGLRTLEARLERITATTQERFSAYLKNHPGVESVLFPLDESFPQYRTGQKANEKCLRADQFFCKSGQQDRKLCVFAKT